MDIVKLLQVYGMESTEESELKHRRPKKITTEEISMVPIRTLSGIHTTDLAHKSPLVLRGSPLEYSVDDVEWQSCEDILPIESYIVSHTIPMEMANPLDWSSDMHLIEIDDVHTDVVNSNIELNGTS